MDVVVESANGFDPDSHFFVLEARSPAAPLPDDMAWRIDPDHRPDRQPAFAAHR